MAIIIWDDPSNIILLPGQLNNFKGVFLTYYQIKVKLLIIGMLLKEINLTYIWVKDLEKEKFEIPSCPRSKKFFKGLDVADIIHTFPRKE